MKGRRIILTVWCLCLAWGITAQESRQWSLEECIRYALDHNLNIKMIELQKEQAAVQLNTSQMSRLPNLNAGGGQNWNFGRTQTQSGLYENQTLSNSSFSINSSMPVFTGFRIPNEIARNKLELEAALQNLERAKEDLSLSIAQLYLQVLFNQELLKVNQEQLALTQEQVKKTRILLEVEKVPAAQLYDIEAQQAADEVSLVQAQNNLDLAMLDLKQSLELEGDAGFDIVVPVLDDVIASQIESLQNPEVIFANAIRVKPAVREQEYKVESSHKSLKIAEAGYMPSINLGLGFGTNYFYNYDIGNLNRSFSDQVRNNAGESVSLSLSIPIFNRFSVRNQVRQARLNISNQELALDNAKKTLYKEIQTAYLNAVASGEKYVASERAVKANTESFASAQDRYELGKLSVFEFNEVKTRLVRSRSEMVQAKYDYIFRSKILDFYNGRPIEL